MYTCMFACLLGLFICLLGSLVFCQLHLFVCVSVFCLFGSLFGFLGKRYVFFLLTFNRAELRKELLSEITNQALVSEIEKLIEILR